MVARVFRDAGCSEETTQEVYLEVWRSASEYDPAKGRAGLAADHRHADVPSTVRAEQAGSRRKSRRGRQWDPAVAPPATPSRLGDAGDERRRVLAFLTR